MKPIFGYCGKYFITESGEVYNKVGLKMKQQTDKYGYRYIKLCLNGVEKKHKIHRLVAEAFIPNLSYFKQVNHKDDCKTNNNVNNLEWCDAEYNNSYGGRLSKIRKRIAKISENGNMKVYNSIKEVESSGYILSCVKLCLSGKQNKHKGFYWEYL